MIDPTKPDLEESVNVTEAHERVVRGAAAAARENKLKENGAEPISLWVMMLCSIPLLAAGWTLGNAGSFSYKDTVKDGYVRLIPSDGEGDVIPPKEALAAYMAKGAKIYAKCIGCHGPDGKGNGSTYPSLAGSKWVEGETERFAMVILNGISGATSTGKDFGSAMPAQGIGMKPEELAALMTFVRNSFGNKVGDVVTTEMATAAMEVSGKRAKAGAPVTAAELTADHVKNLPGTPLDPKTMLDPITLEAVAAP